MAAVPVHPRALQLAATCSRRQRLAGRQCWSRGGLGAGACEFDSMWPWSQMRAGAQVCSGLCAGKDSGQDGHLCAEPPSATTPPTPSSNPSLSCAQQSGPFLPCTQERTRLHRTSMLVLHNKAAHCSQARRSARARTGRACWCFTTKRPIAPQHTGVHAPAQDEHAGASRHYSPLEPPCALHSTKRVHLNDCGGYPVSRLIPGACSGLHTHAVLCSV